MLFQSGRYTFKSQHKPIAVRIIITVSFVLCAAYIKAQENTAVFLKESFDYAANISPAKLTGGTGWKSPWETSQPSSFMVNEGKMKIAGMGKVSRQLPVLSSGRIWMAFTFQQENANGELSFSLVNNNTEKIRIGTKQGKEQLHIGNTSLQAGRNTAHLLLIRFDLHNGKDIAYVFVDPNTASEPDIEGANAVIKGEYGFNEINISSSTNETRGSIDDIVIAGNFSDVAQRKTNRLGRVTGASMKVLSWKKENGGLQIITTGGVLQLTPFLDKTLKVRFGSLKQLSIDTSFAVSRSAEKIVFDVKESGEKITLSTPEYTAVVDKQTSRLQLLDKANKLLITESYAARNVVLHDSVIISSRFSLKKTEALYGLGQFRDGALNLRGKERELVQVNTQAAVPVLLSTEGWGMFWDNPSRTIFSDNAEGMSFISDIGDVICYYLFTGSKLDDLVSQYRTLTGIAPMLPAWALGYHQSRNKYATQNEVLAIASRMKQEHIPFSSIFIDYFYWGKNGTGSHTFDTSLFSDVPGMVRTLHKEYNAKAVITVWPAFRPGTANYAAMQSGGYLLDSVKALDGIVYDAFNPKAAALYWKQVATQLVPQQIDGWFLDGPEPDNIASFLKAKTYYGAAPKVRNLFPLVHSTTFYNGLLQVNPDKRPYILTRCAWASQQKNGTAIWSGDIASTFDELKKQVVAGLNFTATGIPYWTTDIGGYSGGNPSDEKYREVFVRWWQYGTFCPIFRSHGRRFPGDTKGPNELWAFGENVQRICTGFDSLRYRLFPYIYSLSGAVTQKNYTPMRLLAFDFPADTSMLNIADQFMYGPSLLINPVLEAGARKRNVVLPAHAAWTDFWTGEQYKGGNKITADAPIDQLPLFVKQGAIIPTTNALTYQDEPGKDTVTLCVYTGANGDFLLYEDDGTSFSYKQDVYSKIQLRWNDKQHVLTLGAQKGSYRKGVKRVFVIKKIGRGVNMFNASITATIVYNGAQKNITLP